MRRINRCIRQACSKKLYSTLTRVYYLQSHLCFTSLFGVSVMLCNMADGLCGLQRRRAEFAVCDEEVIFGTAAPSALMEV